MWFSCAVRLSAFISSYSQCCYELAFWYATIKFWRPSGVCSHQLFFFFLFLLNSEASQAGTSVLDVIHTLSGVQFHYWNFAARPVTQKKLLLLSGWQASRDAVYCTIYCGKTTLRFSAIENEWQPNTRGAYCHVRPKSSHSFISTLCLCSNIGHVASWHCTG